ncbi:MAG TPA: outer membrane beta-barrel protein [Gemmatimonadales bacterium]|nr:outer membrane beta-barrel protein [Gemmatimonadales bacterium]HEV8599293.1 outer membrane beta-barrel protein [Gemmatimonadales bacterium]
MRRLTAMMVGAVAVLGAGSATAQVRGYVQLGPGLAIPLGDYKDEHKTGWLGQVASGISSGMWGGRVSGSYIRNDFEGTDFHTRILGAMADLVVSPKSGGNVGPYLLGGIGFQNVKANIAADPGSTDFAWNAGAGLTLKTGGFGIFVEGRFLQVRAAGGSLNVIPITAGLRFGGF